MQPVFFHGAAAAERAAAEQAVAEEAAAEEAAVRIGRRRLVRPQTQAQHCPPRRHPDGLPLYRFQYIWGGPDYVGVMAQDLIGLRPDALIVDESGYYRVDYDKLGFQMQTLEDYERRLAFA